MKHYLRFLISLLLVIVWSMGGFAQTTETINIADYVPSSGSKQITYTKPLEQNGFKIYIDKKSSNNPGLYKNGSNLRFYSTDILHIESTKGDISSVEFTGTISIKGMNSQIWSGTPSASVAFTGSAINKITVIKITYTDASSSNKTKTTLTFPQKSFSYTTIDDLTFTGQKATLKAEGSELTGKTIKYTKTGDDIFTSLVENTGVLVLNGKAGTATVNANFAGDDTYAPSTASYTVTVKEVIKDIATLKPLITATNYKKAQSFTLKLTDAVVTYTSGDVAYLEDATGGLYVNAAHNLKVNNKINGLVDIKIYKDQGQRRINSWTLSDATVENITEFNPTVVTVAELNADIDRYENMRVKGVT